MITHRNDSTGVIPPRELKKLVYGPDSVFARSPTAAQVASMTHADVVEFLQKWERPDNAVFGMAGALSPTPAPAPPPGPAPALDLPLDLPQPPPSTPPPPLPMPVFLPLPQPQLLPPHLILPLLLPLSQPSLP